MKIKSDNHKLLVNRRMFIKSSGLFASGICMTGLSSVLERIGKEPAYFSGSDIGQQSSLRLSTFRVDVTPPLDSPLCGGLVKPVAGVTEPLLALGIVIIGAGQPVVICAVDWCEIHNSDHVLWREHLAIAAGTTPERVTVHSIHQHNTPIADSIADKIMAECVAPLRVYDAGWGLESIKRVAQGVKEALNQVKPVTHFSFGEAQVSQVASNRRVMGSDGKVAFTRTSATKDPKVREMPEGTIDPMLKTVSFWSGRKKLVAMHYYATHPMSYYGDGYVTSDFVGIAREKCTAEDGVPHIYFNGCGGNITAGKYNDGEKANRIVLANRIYEAITASEVKAKRASIGNVEWRVKPLVLSVNPDFTEEKMLKIISNAKESASVRIGAAMRVSFMRHVAEGIPIQVTSLHLNGNVCLLHLPAESFIEYQLFAQQEFAGKFIATAAYGDTGPVYIPLEKSFIEGGYEPTWAFAAPGSESAIRKIISELLMD
jgi:hypothetical protein